jgi:hypothetical protein
MTGAGFAATGGWLTPRQAFAEARGLVTLIKDSAAFSPVTAYKLRGNVNVLASAMTASTPISLNAGAESGDRVSAKTSCWCALRRRTDGRPIAPVTPAIRIFIAVPSQYRLAATRRLSFGPHSLKQLWDSLALLC